MVILLLQLCLTFGIGNVVAYGHTNNRAPGGLVIWGKDYSGMGRAEILSLLKSRIPDALTYLGQEYPLSLELSYAEIEKWLEDKFPEPTGDWLTDVRQNMVRPAKVSLPEDFGLNKEEVYAQLQSLKAVVFRPMVPAAIKFTDGRLIRMDGQPGEELDIDRTWQSLISQAGQKKIELAVNSIPVKPGIEDMENINKILGDYTTYFNPWDYPRTKNLRLAAEAIDNTLIAPGEIFSFNDVVGERTATAGYLPAYIFVDGIPVIDNGGGICQNSSTLYQTVKMACLPVLERHTHSLPVNYVLSGQDATVAYGQLDFRFQNDTEGYLLISARTGSNWVRVQLFGQEDETHPVPPQPGGYPFHPEEWLIDPR